MVEANVMIVEVKTIIVISVLYLRPIDRDTTRKYRLRALLGYPTGASHVHSCRESRHIGTFQYVFATVGVIIPDPGGIQIHSHGSKAMHPA